MVLFVGFFLVLVPGTGFFRSIFGDFKIQVEDHCKWSDGIADGYFLYLEPKWPLFWLEKALFWGGWPSKIEAIGALGI